jgi:hypothetical protein
MGNPIVRKRDGVEAPYYMRFFASTDEALAFAEMFAQSAESAPTVSLFRAFLLHAAYNTINEETLILQMTQWRLRAKLADELAEADFNRALSFLHDYKAGKEMKRKSVPALKTTAPTPAEPAKQPVQKKERREFVPPPKRK